MTEKEAEKRPEDEAEEDDEEDSDEERSDAASTASTSSVNNVDSSSKKKKKKKKKKKGKGSHGAAGDGSQTPQPAAQPSLTKAQKAEAEKRFTAALDACRGNTDMWVKLAHCNIFDAKAKKLADAVKSNVCVTCLDLSGNNITDEGAQALATMLTESGAPELIELDLRGNPLSPSATQALAAVSRIRRQLVVKVGTLQPPELEKAPTLAGAAANREGPHGASAGMKELLAKGPMFRKYFQTGDDDDDAAGGAGEQEGPLGDGGLAPEDLWSEVKTLVAAGTASIPKLSTLLQQLIAHLNRELGTLQVPHTDAAVDGSRPHIKGCIMNLESLGTILELVPREVTMQYVSESQPAVGSHRVWATEIVSMLLAPNHTALDRLVAGSKLVPRVLTLSLAHPMCSALHTRALRVLRSCCVSKVAELYGPLFTAGMGAGLTVGEGSQEPCASLQQQLTDRASPSLGIPSGKRDPSVGFVLEACKVLRACCDEANRDSILNTNVRRLLLMDPKWSDFVSEAGVLGQLCKEQEGDLGGPRAARVPLEDSNELAELAGGGLISNHEILALLHGMSAFGIQPGSSASSPSSG